MITYNSCRQLNERIEDMYVSFSDFNGIGFLELLDFLFPLHDGNVVAENEALFRELEISCKRLSHIADMVGRRVAAALPGSSMDDTSF